MNEYDSSKVPTSMSNVICYSATGNLIEHKLNGLVLIDNRDVFSSEQLNVIVMVSSGYLKKEQ